MAIEEKTAKKKQPIPVKKKQPLPDYSERGCLYKGEDKIILFSLVLLSMEGVQ